MSIADQYGLKVEYGSLLKSSPAKKQGKPDKQIHEIFEDEKPKAPPASKAKPIVQQLQEKIEAVKPKLKTQKRGRPPAEEKKDVLSMRLDPALIAKIKKHKNWKKIILTVLSHEFDHAGD